MRISQSAGAKRAVRHAIVGGLSTSAAATGLILLRPSEWSAWTLTCAGLLALAGGALLASDSARTKAADVVSSVSSVTDALVGYPLLTGLVFLSLWSIPFHRVDTWSL